jgi:hypothetical protein
MAENQTSDEAIEKADASTKGSGIFAVPDPTSAQPGAVTKIIVKDISYPECVRRGRPCIAFKWVPRILDTSVTKCPYPGGLCKNSCSNDLCLCIDGTCQ